MNPMCREGQAEAYLAHIPMWAKKKNSLEDIRAFLKEMGNPDESMKIIHVAGTNGKGSVCACMTSILKQAGRRVGTFTSPHLIEVRERFGIDGRMAEQSFFEESFERVKATTDIMTAKGYFPPTYFEFLFYMAMDMFSKADLDYVVLETGLGGRLDVTNVVPGPLLCMITSISMDHMAYLGDTIEKIAFEKAGIIKAGVPVVFDCNNMTSASVIEERAAAVKTRAYGVVSGQYEILEYGAGWIRADFTLGMAPDDKFIKDRTGMTVCVPSAAEYQVMNTLLAAEGACLLNDENITPSVVKAGIEAMSWPGRMEEALPGVWLDGAHNEGGIEAFLLTASRMCREQNKRAFLLFSAVSDKEHKRMIRKICRALPLDLAAVADLDSDRKTGRDVLGLEFAEAAGCPVKAWSSAEDAFLSLTEEKDEEHLVFVVGSLYLIGEIEALVRRKQDDRF